MNVQDIWVYIWKHMCVCPGPVLKQKHPDRTQALHLSGGRQEFPMEHKALRALGSQAKPTWMHSGKQRAISLIAWINGSSLGFQWVNPCHEYTSCCLCRRQAWGGTFHGSLKQAKSGLPVSTESPMPAHMLIQRADSKSCISHKPTVQPSRMNKCSSKPHPNNLQAFLVPSSGSLWDPDSEFEKTVTGKTRKKSQYLQAFGVTCCRNALCVILTWELYYFEQIHAKVLQFHFYCDWSHFFWTARVTASWAEHRRKERTLQKMFYV